MLFKLGSSGTITAAARLTLHCSALAPLSSLCRVPHYTPGQHGRHAVATVRPLQGFPVDWPGATVRSRGQLGSQIDNLCPPIGPLCTMQSCSLQSQARPRTRSTAPANIDSRSGPMCRPPAEAALPAARPGGGGDPRPSLRSFAIFGPATSPRPCITLAL